jgi:hypothetical protein
MPNIVLDKERARLDALVLLNGDVESALEFDEPAIEEIATHPGDGEEDVATLRLVIGGEYTMCVCPPLERAVSWDVAEAIKRSGLHIVGLLQENEHLAAVQGKDLAELNRQLVVVLKDLAEEHARFIRLACRGLRIDSEAQVSDALSNVDQVLERCGTRRK